MTATDPSPAPAPVDPKETEPTPLPVWNAAAEWVNTDRTLTTAAMNYLTVWEALAKRIRDLL